MNGQLTPDAILAWVRLGSELTQIGVNAVVGVKNAIKAIHAEATEEQLAAVNAIIEDVMSDARRRKALADADAAGTPI